MSGPHCYRCRRSTQFITAPEWASRTGEDLARAPFPVHIARFWYCSSCDETGARLIGFAWDTF